jgi:hypothetical protein
MPALPDWDRVCKKIVDGEDGRKKCAAVLESELGDLAAEEAPGWFDRFMEGEPVAVLTVAIPLALLVGYIYLRKSAPTGAAVAS